MRKIANAKKVVDNLFSTELLSGIVLNSSNGKQVSTTNPRTASKEAIFLQKGKYKISHSEADGIIICFYDYLQSNNTFLFDNNSPNAWLDNPTEFEILSDKFARFSFRNTTNTNAYIELIKI